VTTYLASGDSSGASARVTTPLPAAVSSTDFGANALARREMSCA
jgi:hypothetical protein